MRQPREFERAYRSYYAAKKLGVLSKEDKEPTAEQFDLSEWEADKIRKKVEQFNESET